MIQVLLFLKCDNFFFQLLEMFGAGTACVVCPIRHILYEDRDLFIPTMDNGAEVSKRCYQELTDIQVFPYN